MISISTGAFYERGSNQLSSLRAKAETLQDQIGTGERLQRSSDDPVAAARLRMLDRNERLASVDTRNSQLAETDLALTDQALESSADLIIRARELAVQAASDTLNDEQRAAIGIEIASLRESLVALANSRNAAGHALLGGQATGDAYFDDGTTVQFVGTTSVAPIDIGLDQKVVPGVVGPDVFEFETATGTTDLFAVLAALSTALSSGGQASGDASSAALADLETGLDKVTTAQTVVGSRLNWLDLMTEKREVNAEQIAEDRADAGGTDIATTMTRLQETLTVLEASQASFVRLANLSLFSMLR